MSANPEPAALPREVEKAIEGLIAGAWELGHGRLRTEYALADFCCGLRLDWDAVLASARPHLEQLPLEPPDEQKQIHADNLRALRAWSMKHR
jgi:hypothetical protein